MSEGAAGFCTAPGRNGLRLSQEGRGASCSWVSPNPCNMASSRHCAQVLVSGGATGFHVAPDLVAMDFGYLKDKRDDGWWTGRNHDK